MGLKEYIYAIGLKIRCDQQVQVGGLDVEAFAKVFVAEAAFVGIDPMS